jgi:hypothetical protein
MAVFWDVTPYCLVDTDRRFKDLIGFFTVTAMMTVKAVNSSETSVSICHTTWRSIPEDGSFHCET